jgi:hypothetical protein
VQKFLETGQGLFEEGKYEEAGKQFQEILKLDTQHGQAKELLEKAREEIARVASVRQGLNAGAQALNQGDLTVAESELGKVLELDQESPEAKALIDKLGTERSAREKRARFQEAMRQARTLLIRESYEECVQLLGGMEREFAQEEELQQLLHTAREGLEEQERRQAINAKANEARGLLLDQKNEEAVQFLETAAKEFPEEDEFKRLLETAREGWEQQKRRETVAAKTKEARDLLGQQKYQESVQLLEAAVKEFPEEEEFTRLLETAREGWEQQKRGESLAAKTKEARDLLGQQKYQESVQLLEAAVKEFPEETGFGRLLRTAREGWEQQKKRETLAAKTDDARTLLGQQEYQQALGILDELLKSYPRETAVVKLRKLVVQEEKEYERQQQYDKDRVQLQELIQKKDYVAALELGERLQKAFTDDTEVGRLVSSVRREKKVAERQEQLAAARQSIEKQLEEKKFAEAIRDAEKALKKFKGESALSDLLAQAKTSKEEEEKEGRARETGPVHQGRHRAGRPHRRHRPRPPDSDRPSERYRCHPTTEFRQAGVGHPREKEETRRPAQDGSGQPGTQGLRPGHHDPQGRGQGVSVRFRGQATAERGPGRRGPRRRRDYDRHDSQRDPGGRHGPQRRDPVHHAGTPGRGSCAARSHGLDPAAAHADSSASGSEAATRGPAGGGQTGRTSSRRARGQETTETESQTGCAAGG